MNPSQLWPRWNWNLSTLKAPEGAITNVSKPSTPSSHKHYNNKIFYISHEQNPNTKPQNIPGMYWSPVLVSSVPSDVAMLMAACTRGCRSTHLRALLRTGRIGASAGICRWSAFALAMSRLHTCTATMKVISHTLSTWLTRPYTHTFRMQALPHSRRTRGLKRQGFLWQLRLKERDVISSVHL